MKNVIWILLVLVGLSMATFIDGRSFPVGTETPIDNLTSALQPGTNTILLLNSTGADNGNITIYYLNSSLDRKTSTFVLHNTSQFNTTYNTSLLNVSDFAYVTGVYYHGTAAGVISVKDSSDALIWEIPAGASNSAQSIFVCSSEYGCSISNVLSSSDSVVRWACKVGSATETIAYAWYTGAGITNNYFPPVKLAQGQRVQFYVTGYTANANASLYFTPN